MPEQRRVSNNIDIVGHILDWKCSMVRFLFLAEPSKSDAAPSDRDAYRRTEAGDKKEGDKKGEAGAGSYEFKGGFGRGKKPQ